MKRSTLVAFAVLVVLIGVVYWLDRNDGSSADVDRVFDVDEENIDRVEIRRAADEVVVIERGGDAFRIVAPVDAACDQTEVDLLLSNLATMTVIRSLDHDPDADMSEYGLDAPSLEVRFVDGDGREHAVRFGNDTLTGTSQYAEREGLDAVLVVGNHLARNLGKSAWELRDKAIYHFPDDAEPERVAVTRGADVFELVADDGFWMTAATPRARVDRFAVTGMVARFRRAEMLDIPAGATIETPSIRLEVTFTDDVEPLVLEIGEKRNVDYLARVPERDQVFLIEGGLVGELDKDVTGWWSRKLLHHATTESTVTRISSGGNEVSMDREQAQELLSALSKATVAEIVTEPPPGGPDYVIAVATEDAEDEISIRLTNGVAYASREGEDIALRLSAEAWSAIEAQL